MTARTRWLGGAALIALLVGGTGRTPAAQAETLTGVTPTDIKIGNTIPYSGPASAYGVIGRAMSAYFKMVKDQGGIAGHKITFISLDDGYSPPRTVEDTRRLVEEDQVAFTLAQLGTAEVTATRKYMNAKKVPQLFVATGADKWGDYQQYPWTIGLQPSYRVEAQIYAKYILRTKPDAKVGVIYQNDDFGKDYLAGLHDVLGDRYSKLVVKEVSYETTDPTVDSQVVSLQNAGADVVVDAATPKFAAQVIHKIADLGWKPVQLMSNVSVSVGAVMIPAGADRGIGVISAAYGKDQTDPAWANDPGMNGWRAFMKQYMPGADLNDAGYESGYGDAVMMMQVLKQCNGDFSRENVMKQATNIHDFELPTLLPGIKVNTSPTNYHPIRAMQLERWNGKSWERFGDVIEGSPAS